MPHYEIRLVGEGTRGAEVDGALLRDLLDAMVEGVRRAVRLRVEGRSSAPGAAPGWLDEAARFTVTAIREGSTILELEAPLLDGAVMARSGLGPLFEGPEQPETGIGWFRESLESALDGQAESDTFDAGLLSSIGEWKGVLAHGVAAVELSNEAGGMTRIDAAGLANASKLQRAVAPARRVRVSGWLEAIQHSNRAFTLKLEDGSELRGIAPEVPVDQLRRLFGHKATVPALAHFRPSGRVLRLEAERIEPAGDDFSAWSREPVALFGKSDQASLRVPQGPRSGVNAIFGQWPGEETDEEILRALEEVS